MKALYFELFGFFETSFQSHPNPLLFSWGGNIHSPPLCRAVPFQLPQVQEEKLWERETGAAPGALPSNSFHSLMMQWLMTFIEQQRTESTRALLHFSQSSVPANPGLSCLVWSLSAGMGFEFLRFFLTEELPWQREVQVTVPAPFRAAAFPLPKWGDSVSKESLHCFLNSIFLGKKMIPVAYILTGNCRVTCFGNFTGNKNIRDSMFCVSLSCETIAHKNSWGFCWL